MISLRWTAAALAVAVLGATGATARAESSEKCYSLDATVLTGPGGADLTLRVTTAAGCAVPTSLKKLQVKTWNSDERLEVSNLKDVPLAASGTASVGLGGLARGNRVEADALIDPGDGTGIEVVRSGAVALLRPDLVVASVQAPAQTLSVRAVDVRAEIAERNGDVGAKATGTLAWGPLLDRDAAGRGSLRAAARRSCSKPWLSRRRFRLI